MSWTDEKDALIKSIQASTGWSRVGVIKHALDRSHRTGEGVRNALRDMARGTK